MYLQGIASKCSYVNSPHAVKEKLQFLRVFVYPWHVAPLLKRKHVSFINCCESTFPPPLLLILLGDSCRCSFLLLSLVSFLFLLLVHKDESPCTYFAMFLLHSLLLFLHRCNKVGRGTHLKGRQSNGLDQFSSLGWLSVVRGRTNTPPPYISHFNLPQQSTDIPI